MTEKPLALESMPGYLIRRSHQISVGLFHEACGEMGLTPIQFALLSGIDARPGLDQIQLSRLVGVDRATIGNVISRLEGRGHILRTPDERDRRVKRLALTGSGEAALEAARPLVKEVQDRLLEPLSAEERTLFVRLLGRLVLENAEGSRVPSEPVPQSA
ncbi:MAG: MarR family transcriptional regulator [Rhodospirillum sp.]|nr:MarR family transcriptional regulator [Rhodospirillum sp.]MCF8489764.1 MarR family transcriptional regulator [Rhodospirillum sp.]MCF8501271.1 MarR family transcriptional regulator [Rhodospirillum sp.]